MQDWISVPSRSSAATVDFMPPAFISSLAAFMAFALPVLMMPGPRGTVVWAALVALAFLVAWWRGGLRLSAPAAWWLLAGLVAWSSFTWFWSVEPDRTLQRVPRMAATAALGVALLSVAQGLEARLAVTVRRALVAGFTLTGLAMALERMSGAQLATLLGDLEWMDGNLIHRLTIYNRSLSILLPLGFLSLSCWPRLTARWRLALLGGTACLFASTPFYVGAAQTGALLAGLIVAGAAFWSPRVMPRVLAILLVAAALLGPVLLPPTAERLAEADIGQDSEHPAGGPLAHRLSIWSFVAERTGDRVLTGWGAEAARAIPGAAEITVAGDPASKRVPHHPHNAILQVWVELGLVGAVLLAALLGLLTWRCGAGALGDGDRRWLVAGRCGAVTTATAIACASFGIWQEWWLAGLLILVAVSLLLGRTPSERGAA